MNKELEVLEENINNTQWFAYVQMSCSLEEEKLEIFKYLVKKEYFDISVEVSKELSDDDYKQANYCLTHKGMDAIKEYRKENKIHLNNFCFSKKC